MRNRRYPEVGSNPERMPGYLWLATWVQVRETMNLEQASYTEVPHPCVLWGANTGSVKHLVGVHRVPLEGGNVLPKHNLEATSWKRMIFQSCISRALVRAGRSRKLDEG